MEVLERSLAHYREGLGFDCRYSAPEPEPFFAIVGRGAAQIMLKAVGDGVVPVPNRRAHAWAPWDAFVLAGDPDALAAENAGRAVAYAEPLGNREDGLRGFAVADPDGYVCFFGRPV
ncbi:MAG: hypothetical protein AAFV49_17410 [Pseudomonadota bacterium]